MASTGVPGYVAAMLRKLWFLVLVMIAASLVTTATVHARELAGPVAFECTGIVHDDRAADPSAGEPGTGDPDTAVPHQHGTCHGPSLHLPTASRLSSLPKLNGLRPLPAAVSGTASHLTDPALRPPTA